VVVVLGFILLYLETKHVKLYLSWSFINMMQNSFLVWLFGKYLRTRDLRQYCLILHI